MLNTQFQVRLNGKGSGLTTAHLRSPDFIVGFEAEMKPSQANVYIHYETHPDRNDALIYKVHIHPLPGLPGLPGPVFAVDVNFSFYYALLSHLDTVCKREFGIEDDMQRHDRVEDMMDSVLPNRWKNSNLMNLQWMLVGVAL